MTRLSRGTLAKIVYNPTMKILIGAPEYLPYQTGGGADVYKNLALEFKKLGQDIVVIYGYYPTESWQEKIKKFKRSGITFYQVPEIPFPKSLPYLKIRMPISLQAYKQLKQIISHENPDISHLHGYGFPFIEMFAHILVKQGRKYILTIHGWPVKQNESRVMKSLWFFYDRFVLNKVLDQAEKITCVSEFIKKQLLLKYQSKTSVIYNGINFSQIKQSKLKVNVRHKYSIDKETLIILSLGRIAKIKGFDEMIKKIPDLLKHNLEVVYFIAGEDEGYKNHLQKLIWQLNLKQYVRFIGFLNEETKKQYLDQCDILAAPSLMEGFGFSSLEGMAFNKLILTGKPTGTQEVLSEYNKWVSIYDPDLIKKISSKLRIKGNFEVKKFNWNSIAKQYLKLFVKYG